MPTADVVLLPVCAVIGLVGLVLAVIFFIRRKPGRAVQSIGLALFAAALYLTRLFPVVWDFVAGIVDWAIKLAFSPQVWFGLGTLVLAVVFWIVGGFVAGRAKVRAKAEKVAGKTSGVESSARPAVGTGTARPAAAAKKAPAGKQQAQSDPEMDEIEALLKSRGIE